MKDILRKKSLERLSSPEQLDRLLVIIRLPGWISLVCLIVLIFGIVLWSIFGRIPVKAEGSGIFFDLETIEVIQTTTDGIIDKIYVKEGEIAEKNAPLILLKDPETLTKKREIEEQIYRSEREIALEKKEIEISLAQNRAIHELQAERLQELKGASNKSEELYELQVAMKRQEEIIALLEKQLAQPEESLTLEQLKKELNDLREREKEMLIRSPAKGKVLAIEAIYGEGVRFGKNLIWFQKLSDEDERIVYSFFSVAKGSSIEPGMRAHVQFDTVQTERYGKMIGTVKDILFFAGGPNSEILQSIPSPSLRKYLSDNEASVVVLIEPKRDDSTPTGFLWTTGEGPPRKIDTDSITRVEVFLEEKRPIAYLIPIGEN